MDTASLRPPRIHQMSFKIGVPRQPGLPHFSPLFSFCVFTEHEPEQKKNGGGLGTRLIIMVILYFSPGSALESPTLCTVNPKEQPRQVHTDSPANNSYCSVNPQVYTLLLQRRPTFTITVYSCSYIMVFTFLDINFGFNLHCTYSCL